MTPISRTFTLVFTCFTLIRTQGVRNSFDDAEFLLRKHHEMKSFGPSFWIGEFPPEPVTKLESDESFQRLTRSRDHRHTDEICQTNRIWKQINETSNIFGQAVQIVHTLKYKQFVYVYECISKGESCLGLSKQYKSSCETRTGWAYMLYRKATTSENSPATPFEWGYVSVPHHCACRLIRPRLEFYLP